MIPTKTSPVLTPDKGPDCPGQGVHRHPPRTPWPGFDDGLLFYQFDPAGLDAVAAWSDTYAVSVVTLCSSVPTPCWADAAPSAQHRYPRSP